MSVPNTETSENFAALSRVLDRLKSEEKKKVGRPRRKEKPPVEDQTPNDPERVANPDRWPLTGFAPMTRISTSFGEVHAIALRKGDLVKTRDGRFKPIVWLNRVLLEERFLAEKPDSNPIRVQAGALGPACPRNDIMVSPRQIICPTPKTSLSAPREAADLTSRPGVLRQRESGLSYTMFHLGEPADVHCEGVFVRVEPPGD